MREYTYICLNGICFTLLHCNPFSKGTVKVKNPVSFSADYFGHKLDLDQNEKLIRYGVTHVVATDRRKRFVVAASKLPIENNIVYYDEIYR